MDIPMEYIKLTPGFRTALADGVLVPDSPKHMTTESFYHAQSGGRLHLRDLDYLFAAAVFSLERDPNYIYSYAYQPEENWTTYTQNLTPQSYGQEDYIFNQECWFRVCVRRKDGADLSEADEKVAGHLLEFYNKAAVCEEKEYFTKEIEMTVAAIQKAAGGKALVDKEEIAKPSSVMKLCLLADTHYTINGTWEDTAHNIQKVAEKVDYDAIIHLGDLTDGMLSKEITRAYVRHILQDLERCGVPLYVTPGNHDSNYFRNRDRAFTAQEMKELYCLYGPMGTDEEMNSQGIDYYVDVSRYSVRMIFLSSFEDAACIRYGYTRQQLEWLKGALYTAEPGSRFLVFSHDAPLAKLDYWSFHIRNGEELLDILEECNQKEEYQVVGLFYGHTHGDYVFEESSFPLISVGCAKLEYFLDKKPEGTVTCPRKAGTVSQDLWDSLLIDFEQEKLTLVRFGAGEDRKVSFRKKNSRYRDIIIQKRRERKTKVWAHRGASGHAPENTLPAFELAYKLGADGIELDVHLTRDGELVVLHDERIDRVSDGLGYVKDYTWEELKRFHVNKSFPAYGRVEIPTLAEVYDLVKMTGMWVNLELKNSEIFYEGLEEKVLKLAEEKGMADRIVYSSFNHQSMVKLKKMAPSAKIAFLYSCGLAEPAEYGKRHRVYAMHPSLRQAEWPGMIRECHEKGIKVHVWTVNGKEEIARMKELGADCVITNYPERE